MDTAGSRVLLGGDLRITRRAQFVLVWHRRAASDLLELEQILGEIDTTLEATDLSNVMFDSREAQYKEGEVQARMWDWLENHPRLRRVATLVESPRLAVSVQLTGLTRRVKIKAFHDETEAAAWLAM